MVLPPANPEGDTTPHAHRSSMIWNPECRWTRASLEHGSGFIPIGGEILLSLKKRNGNCYLRVDLLLVDVLPGGGEIGRWAASFIAVSFSTHHGSRSLFAGAFLHS